MSWHDWLNSSALSSFLLLHNMSWIDDIVQHDDSWCWWLLTVKMLYWTAISTDLIQIMAQCQDCGGNYVFCVTVNLVMKLIVVRLRKRVFKWQFHKHQDNWTGILRLELKWRPRVSAMTINNAEIGNHSQEASSGLNDHIQDGKILICWVTLMQH